MKEHQAQNNDRSNSDDPSTNSFSRSVGWIRAMRGARAPKHGGMNYTRAVISFHEAASINHSPMFRRRWRGGWITLGSLVSFRGYLEIDSRIVDWTHGQSINQRWTIVKRWPLSRLEICTWEQPSLLNESFDTRAEFLLDNSIVSRGGEFSKFLFSTVIFFLFFLPLLTNVNGLVVGQFLLFDRHSSFPKFISMS